MIPIGGRPILWHIMKGYEASGFSEFVLCLGYKGEAISAFFLNFEAYTNDLTITLGPTRTVEIHGQNQPCEWRVTLANTGAQAFTGARVRRIEKFIGDDETFMLTYGDGLSDVDLPRLIDFHRKHGKVLTVTGVRPPGRFGEMEMSDDGCVLEFNEKPQASDGLISGGFFVCNRKIFDYLDDREHLTLEQEPIQRLVADGQMMVYRHDGFWQCMDTARDHSLLNRLWHDGEAPWKKW